MKEERKDMYAKEKGEKKQKWWKENNSGKNDEKSEMK